MIAPESQPEKDKKNKKKAYAPGLRSDLKKEKNYFWSENFSTTRTLSPRTVMGIGTIAS